MTYLCRNIRYLLKMNRNNFTSLILLAGIVTVTSCVEEKRPTPVRQRINVTPPIERVGGDKPAYGIH